MDTQWYAVDAEGHIAYSETGESGCVPHEVGDIHIEDLLAQLRGRPFTEEEEDALREEVGERARDAGIFVYELDADYASYESPYRLVGVPAKPIHVDQLPPALRQMFKRVHLDKISFPEARLLQLYEHVACSTWGTPRAYLASDGVTLRPVPGREHEVAEFIDEIKVNEPELLERFTIGDMPGDADD
jgi:hypothetical protein